MLLILIILVILFFVGKSALGLVLSSVGTIAGLIILGVVFAIRHANRRKP